MRTKKESRPVMLRVFLNGEMSNFGSTKIFVDKTVWNNATSRLKGRTAEALSVNAALDSISTTLNGIYRKFEDDESLSLEKIRSFFVGKTGNTRPFSLYSTSSTKMSDSVLDTPSAKIVCKSTVF